MKLFGFEIKKETEKAVLIAALVCWGNGNNKVKEIWMPKSAISFDGDFAVVKDWFINKLSADNAYMGYPMEFVNSSNI